MAVATAADLSLFLKAPSKDAISSFFSACFLHRHALTPAPLAAAAASLLSLPADDASRAALAGNSLLRRLLYESSELQTVDAVRALLPRGLDARLEGLLSGVRGRLSSARCRVLVCAPFHPSLTRSHFFIFSACVRC